MIDSMKTKTGIALAFTVLLGGCASAQLATPEGYRDYVERGGFGSQSDAIDSSISAPKVVSLLDKQSKMCLERTVSFTTTQGNGMGGMIHVRETYHLIPEVSVQESGGGQMVLRRKDENQSIFTKAMLTEEMKNKGYIVMVADVSPMSAGSHVEIYGGSRGYDHVFDAVKSWASGEHTQCPEF